MHPRAKKPFYFKLAEEYNLAIADEPLYGFLPVASIFMATLSTTVRWAALLKIPSIILRYGITDSYFNHLQGNTILEENDIAAQEKAIDEYINDPLAYKRAQATLAEAVKDEIFDGKVRQRILDDLEQKIRYGRSEPTEQQTKSEMAVAIQ